MIPVLTVVYHETQEHYNMALNAWKSFPIDCGILAVVNKKYDAEYPDNVTYIDNDENCLSKAWNIGLREILETYDYAVVSGLDSISPSNLEINSMINDLRKNPDLGLVSATSEGMAHVSTSKVPVAHGDSSFSFFVLSKSAYEKVGPFDERYKPAYFEDDDYLERLWQNGFTPVRRTDIQYYHVFQGTVKLGGKVKEDYPVFMQKNLELFKKTYGKVPDHLPRDIKFN